ncbi:MAG: hypothetical protein WBF33_01660, partial [Candidatus Nitrosopolaris sp.]
EEVIQVLEIFRVSHKHLKCLCCYNILIVIRSFENWWRTVPIELQQKTRKGNEQNKPLLN